MTREAYYNGLISVATDIENQSSVLSRPYWYSSTADRGEIVGCALHAIPDGLLLADMPEDAIPTTIDRFLSEIKNPTRIIGPPDTTTVAAEIIIDAVGARKRATQAWNILQATRIDALTEFRDLDVARCSSQDEQLVRAWGEKYERESPSNVVSVQAFLMRKLRSGCLYKLEKDGPKSIASVSAPTENGIRISSVYTPAEFRQSGFASALVGGLTLKLLTSGNKFVTLSVTDETTLKIDYTKLGYHQIGSRKSVVFS
jgi:predicted GNAT family acetyltransferase